MKFEIKKSKNGQFYFNLLARNNKTVATSELYTRKENALNTAIADTIATQNVLLFALVLQLIPPITLGCFFDSAILSFLPLFKYHWSKP